MRGRIHVERKIYSLTSHSNGRISISMAYREDAEKLCDTSDKVLDYMVGLLGFFTDGGVS